MNVPEALSRVARLVGAAKAELASIVQEDAPAVRLPIRAAIGALDGAMTEVSAAGRALGGGEMPREGAAPCGRSARPGGRPPSEPL